MSLLTRAAGKFDAAFSALPPEARQRVGLAIYRVYPTLQQYARDLEPLTAAAGVKAATWDLVIALGFRLIKRRDKTFEFSEKELAELVERAPAVAEFARHIAAAIEGKPMIDVVPTSDRKKLR